MSDTSSSAFNNRFGGAGAAVQATAMPRNEAQFPPSAASSDEEGESCNSSDDSSEESEANSEDARFIAPSESDSEDSGDSRVAQPAPAKKQRIAADAGASSSDDDSDSSSGCTSDEVPSPVRGAAPRAPTIIGGGREVRARPLAPVTRYWDAANAAAAARAAGFPLTKAEKAAEKAARDASARDAARERAAEERGERRALAAAAERRSAKAARRATMYGLPPMASGAAASSGGGGAAPQQPSQLPLTKRRRPYAIDVYNAAQAGNRASAGQADGL